MALNDLNQVLLYGDKSSVGKQKRLPSNSKAEILLTDKQDTFYKNI